MRDIYMANIIDKRTPEEKARQAEQGRRIVKLRDIKGFTQDELSRAIGLSSITAVQNWEHGKNDVARRNQLRLAKALNTTFAYISTETDDPSPHSKNVQSNAVHAGTIEPWDSRTPIHDDDVSIKFMMDVELSAGNGREPGVENNGFSLRFAKSTLKRCGVDPNSAYCVKVTGDSMQPRLYDGDVVGVDTASKKIAEGSTYAISYCGELMVKRLLREKQGAVIIRSLNPDYEDRLVSSDDRDELSIIGRVFWHSSIWN